MKKPEDVNPWKFWEEDFSFLETIAHFIPEKVYDMHAHWYRQADLNSTEKTLWTTGPEIGGLDQWTFNIQQFFPKASLLGGLFFPAPLPKVNLSAANQFLSEELGKSELSRGLMLVKPETSQKELERGLSQHKIVGFKPYHVYSTEVPTAQSGITGFLPEHIWSIAHEHQAVIMLHIMKDKAMLDPQNSQDIYRLCLKYPGVKLILAHCGRSFHALHAEGAKFLKAIPNIWFDMSGICEVQAILPILKHFGPEKLLYGSDFPVSQIRGKCVSIGDGFIWLDEDTCNWNKAWGKPILVGLESLGALQEAANNFGLDKSDVDLIFRGNGMQLLGLENGSKFTNQAYYKHAKNRIPGGTQLLSKRPENMAPNHWPPYFKKASGCEIWDFDGKHFYDMSTNAVGSCLLGYAHPEINKAITKRVQLGNMCSLNPPEEVALADKLCEVHPWAEQTRFVRGGGEACAVAVRIARATTGRNKIALCGYHGWQDWYLAANLGENDALKGHLLPGLNPEGVPDSLRNTAFPFKYNDLTAFREIIDHHEDLAAVIMEPCRYEAPEPGFLETIRTISREKGIVLIMDEITVGWRLNFGGMHLKYNIEPDMAVFAKALGNGYPIGAVIGTKAAMEGANRSFISSTYWTESLGPVAALATIAEMEKLNIQKAIEHVGNMVQIHLETVAANEGIKLHVKGFPALTSFSFDHPESEMLRTIFTQQMLSKGFLAGTSFYPTIAHNEKIIAAYKQALAETFGCLSQVIKENSFEKWPKEEKAQSGFSRLL